MMPKAVRGVPPALPLFIHNLISREKWRWLQQLLRIRRVHHPRYSFGWAFPIGDWVYFERRVFKDDLDRDMIKHWPGHWEQCPPDTYHDCTTTGRY